MKKILVAAALLLVIAVVVAIVMIGGPQGPALSKVEHLKRPRIAAAPAQQMLVVTAKGNPNTVGGAAFGLLMKTYFSLKGVPKGPGMPAPRARWPVAVDTPMDQWTGHYAMPIPDSVTEIPDTSSDGDLTLQLSTWEYGEVAEILHVGPYAAETPTIEQLKAFIADEGYEIAGDHEEEYLRGPGMWFAGDPETYLTIIRYRVKKASAEPLL